MKGGRRQCEAWRSKERPRRTVRPHDTAARREVQRRERRTNLENKPAACKPSAIDYTRSGRRMRTEVHAADDVLLIIKWRQLVFVI